MINDIQPSVLCACFTTEKAWNNFKNELKEQGFNWRELRLIDIGIPLETEEYEKKVNFLRSFTKPILKKFIQSIPFKTFIFKTLGKINLEAFDYENYDNQPDFRTPMAFAGFTPLFIDTKYKDYYSNEEKENLEKLKTFSTRTYKPKSLEEQGIYSEKYFEERDKQKEGVL